MLELFVVVTVIGTAFALGAALIPYVRDMGFLGLFTNPDKAKLDAKWERLRKELNELNLEKQNG